MHQFYLRKKQFQQKLHSAFTAARFFSFLVSGQSSTRYYFQTDDKLPSLTPETIQMDRRPRPDPMMSGKFISGTV